VRAEVPLDVLRDLFDADDLADSSRLSIALARLLEDVADSMPRHA
jgi:hypothetical protein